MSNPKKKMYNRREKKIVEWGGVPKYLEWGEIPTDELLLERKMYLQSLLPEHLREDYVKPKPEPKKTKRAYERRVVKSERTKEKAEKAMLASARCRAKAKGVPFNLELDDVVIPQVCPVFGWSFDWLGKVTDNSPTLDRLIPEKGYTKENVRVICHKANRIKSNGTIEELRKVVEWWDSL